ncbi:MAG: dTDP-4-dehydrorhamnose 3,5-epimerase [Chloroflexota bacterium]|jgi:dTDP-4-dehydrorhamnose 3,5-epimerase|nr:dTDP-4-dehydrorhamnose 3,5-epimerase [Chloroflexota bacterium]
MTATEQARGSDAVGRPLIEGVEIKLLTTHPDERGFFRELIRRSDDFFGEGFAQLSHSLMHPGSGKGWHYHPNQVDWWYCIGNLKVVLYDLREGSPTHRQLNELFMGDNYGAKIIKIPPMVAHGCRALDTTHLLYVTSSVYDPEQEGRIPHDDPEIGYDFNAGPPVK